MAKKTLTGLVTSAKRDKTITVTVTTRATHPLYGKQFTVIKTSGKTKAGRDFINCVLDTESL